MKSKQKNRDDALPDVPSGQDIDDDADTDLDERLDALDVIEAEQRLADPNNKIAPFDPADYE
jgi:hypothetical protein